MSIAAAALALPREFRVGPEDAPTVHQVRPLTYDDLARFSLWLETRAAAAIERAAAAGLPAADQYAGHQVNVVAGQYEPGGDAFDRATRADAGRRKLLELMLVPPDGEKRPAEWRLETSWALFADEAAFGAACLAMAEANLDPLATAARRRPTRRAAPSP